MEPIIPFWVKQRQCKLDPAGENAFKITAPNLGENYLRVFPEEGRWKAAVRTSADGPDLYSTSCYIRHGEGRLERSFRVVSQSVHYLRWEQPPAKPQAAVTISPS